MILLCVGMSEYKFDRLLIMIDELIEEGRTGDHKIVAQAGYTDYKAKNYEMFSVIDRDKFQKYVDEADCIISHAGTGSVIPALKQGKKVIVVPREEQYNEHCDNHQLELCDMLSENEFTMTARNKEELATCIANIGQFKPRQFISNNENICNLIINFIESN